MKQSPSVSIACYVVCTDDAERTPLKVFADLDKSVAFKSAYEFLRSYNSSNLERAVLRRGTSKVSWNVSQRATTLHAQEITPPHESRAHDVVADPHSALVEAV